jgi:hypothetical protein
MSEVLGASAGLPLWLDVTVGILLAVVLTITAELLARYAAKPARRSRSHTRQSPALSGPGLSSAELFSQP